MNLFKTAELLSQTGNTASLVDSSALEDRNPDDLGVNAPRKSHILLAEDDETLRPMMCSFLESGGYRVRACRDGRQAVQAFKDDPSIRLLISDMQMPFVNGADLALALTSHCPALPVILMSGAGLTHEVRELILERNWIFLQKPFTVQRMLAVVHDILENGYRPPYTHLRSA